MMKPYTVPDYAPVSALLACYRHHWERCPLLLVGLPGVPDPRRDPGAAIAAARALAGEVVTYSSTTQNVV